MSSWKWIVGLCLVSVLALGCEAADDAASAAPCSGQSDCPDGSACVSMMGMMTCQLDCTASLTACGAESSCAGVGSLSVNVCQPAKEEPAEGETPSEQDAEEQPSLPCAVDADCAKFQANAICVQFEGAKDCTIPCSVEEDCTSPDMMGFQVDFMTCLPDEADDTRTACVPDVACFADVMSCVTLPEGFGDLGDMDMGMGDMDMEGGEEGDEFSDFF
jgi:hypothetical protein